jgi:2-polyprenyl-3-methyl-5-hydroxy-6-metoxy-1,4-benzoquinol methylase
MLYGSKNTLKLPNYELMKPYDGMGSYAIRKYYQFPFSFFYRKKLKMIVKNMESNNYWNILDFGSGPGIFTDELNKHCITNVTSIDIGDAIDPRWRFDCIVAASVLEFVSLSHYVKLLSSLLTPTGQLIIASPKKNKLTDFYFKMIGDRSVRNSHSAIISEVSKRLRITHYEEWMNLYFCIKAVKP